METMRAEAITDRPEGFGSGRGRRLDLSICSIFKNEAANLPDLIARIPISQVEWIALDTGSTDSTRNLLEEAGVEPHTFSWRDDFAAARNESLRLATRGWILWLDADDRPGAGFWDAVSALLDGPKRAYRFVIRSPREDSRGDSFRQIRLFPNHLGIGFQGRIHEQLGTSLLERKVAVAQSDLEILHLGYDTPAKRQVKLERNRKLLERERREHPRDPAVIMEYGNCLCQSGEFAGAISAYLTLMASPQPRESGPAPEDEVLRHFPALLGDTCAKMGNASQAGEWFQVAARWNPSDTAPAYRLGKMALESGNVHGALEFFYACLERPAAVGRVATDNHTVRRNALALVVLCESRIFGAAKAPRARQCLRELVAGGLDDFPLDYRAPWDILREAGNDSDAEGYARTYLDKFPGDIPMWEDFIEHLFEAKRYREILEALADRPALRLRSGLLEAFRAKCGEAMGGKVEDTYAIYRDAVRMFPDDPTLLVYFSDFVNHNRLYARCYADLKSLAEPSDTVRDFLRQMEALGCGRAH